MIIIVEGMDGSGKTTLVKHLFYPLKLIPRKFVKSFGPEQDYQLKLVADTVAELKELEIYYLWKKSIYRLYDRFPLISEAVYGPILRGSNCFGELHSHLLRQLLFLEPLIIYCRPEKGIIRENLQKSQQMEGVKEHFEELLAAYDKIYQELTESPGRAYITLYDYTKDDLQTLINKIRRFYKHG